MWLFCGGMYRAGSTLQYQIAAAIVEGRNLGGRVEWSPPNQFHRDRAHKGYPDGIKIFKTHECTDQIRELFLNSRAKGLYIYRDLRDVIASLMIKNRATFANVLGSGIIDQAMKNHDDWTGLPHVYLSKYEDIRRDVVSEVLGISSFLKIPVPGEDAAEIADSLEIKKQMVRATYREDKVYAVIGDKMFDPDTLLHIDHIHDGKTGKWKYTLKPEELILLDKRYGDWFRKYGYYQDIHAELNRLLPDAHGSIARHPGSAGDTGSGEAGPGMKPCDAVSHESGVGSDARIAVVLQRRIRHLERQLAGLEDTLLEARRELKAKQAEIDRLQRLLSRPG